MSEISTGQQPFKDLDHNLDLAIAICKGLRPGFSDNTPKCYIELAYKCMNADPEKRPTAKEILEIIKLWRDATDSYSDKDKYSKEQLEELKEKANKLYTST